MISRGVQLLLTALLFASCQTVQTSPPVSIFQFHSSAWVNLHHQLYNEAFRSEKASQPVAGMERKEKAKLAKAIQFYQDTFKGRDLLFDDGMTKISTELSAVENQESLGLAKIPKELLKTLEGYMPIYKRYLWQQQDQENQNWINNAKSLLNKYGAEVQHDLEKVLVRKFSEAPYHVDVVREPNWSGAYTYSPPHTVISSGRPTYSNFAALEMVFHESLHAGPFDNIQIAIDQEFTKNHAKDRDQLWHAILFYTAGEIVRIKLAADGITYQPYAYKNGLFAADRKWGRFEPLLRKHWLPYLQGSGSMSTAISALVQESVR